MTSPLSTDIKLVSASTFSGYALLWESFSRHIAIGDPNQMINLPIVHTFFVKESAASQPFVATADVGIVVGARRTKFGLFVTGRFTPLTTDPRLIAVLCRLAAKGQLHLTPDYKSAEDLQIVRFSLYVPPEILAGVTTPITATEAPPPPSQSDSDPRP